VLEAATLEAELRAPPTELEAPEAALPAPLVTEATELEAPEAPDAEEAEEDLAEEVVELPPTVCEGRSLYVSQSSMRSVISPTRRWKSCHQ
jgi:hypothetical protein